MADEEDPYIIYQLRKPHQRGTAVVPRLVPKSHAPAFSHVSNRFARVCTEDEQLYLPKSLEYPANWGSFGSESSIWSATSSAASAFPNRLQPLSPAATPQLAASSPRRRVTGAESVEDDESRGAHSVASLTERTSLLSSDGTRSLKSFIRFDVPLNSGLQAPVPIRPANFVLPHPLSQVEREDSIVQAAIDDPASVAPTEDDNIIEAPSKSRVESFSRRDYPDQSHSRRRVTVRRQPPAVATRQRRSMWAWLFGGAEKPLGARRFADVHAAPIMDDDEEAQRRAQFVHTGRRDSGRQSRSFANRFSWRKRSTSVDSRRNNTTDRDGEPIVPRRRSSRNLWKSIRRSASFTLGSKNNANKTHLEPQVQFRGAELGDLGSANLKRSDSTVDEGSGANDSFVKRKMASLRETTSRRMAAAANEIGNVNESISRVARKRDTPIIPAERKEDRPRPSKSTPSATSRVSLTNSRASAVSRVQTMKTSPISLTELISARPELQHATSESVEQLANRINSDLSHGSTLRSVSNPSGSLNSARYTPVRETSSGLLDSGNTLQTSAVSSVPSSEGNSEGLLPGLQNIVCEKSASPLLEGMRSYQRPHSRASPRARSAGVPELRLSNASRMSIELLKARAGTTGNTTSISPTHSLRPVFRGGADEKKAKSGVGGSDFSHPHATPIDVFCQCACTCVYESDCQHSCEGKSGNKGSTSSVDGTDGETNGRSKSRKSRELYSESPGAESPSLSLLSGARVETPHNRTTEEWMETIRKRLENFPTHSTAASTPPMVPSYRAVDELPRNAGIVAPSGRYEEVGSSDWGARYGRPAREASGPTIAYEPENNGLHYHPRERVVNKATEVREASPQPSGIVEFRAGIRVERRRGDPLQTRRPNGSSGSSAASSRANSSSTRSTHASSRSVHSPPMIVQQFTSAQHSKTEAKGAYGRGAAKSKPRKPRSRAGTPLAESLPKTGSSNSHNQWSAHRVEHANGQRVIDQMRINGGGGALGRSRVQLVEEAPGRPRRHANIQPKHGRSALREVHRDEVRGSRTKAPPTKNEEEVRRSGGRLRVGRFLGM